MSEVTAQAGGDTGPAIITGRAIGAIRTEEEAEAFRDSIRRYLNERADGLRDFRHLRDALAELRHELAVWEARERNG